MLLATKKQKTKEKEHERNHRKTNHELQRDGFAGQVAIMATRKPMAEIIARVAAQKAEIESLKVSCGRQADTERENAKELAAKRRISGRHC